MPFFICNSTVLMTILDISYEMNILFCIIGSGWLGEWGGLYVPDAFHSADNGILQMGQLWSARWESGAR